MTCAHDANCVCANTGNLKDIEFSAARLRDALARLDIREGTPVCVGYSGGRDSRVLLEGLVDLAWKPLRALHINHQVQAEARQWADEAVAVCTRLGVTCVVRTVCVTGYRRLGPEGAARAARYAVFREVLAAGEVLALAHHGDDQAETVLLQLLRGAGMEGLMGMAPVMPWGRGRLARPLLDVPGQAIETFARTRGLSYIVDPSNSDTRYRRNFLRIEILPRLRRHWPGVERAIGRSARQLQRAQAVWRIYDAAERNTCIDAQGALSLAAWRNLETPRALHVLRLWIREQGGVMLSERSLLALERALREEPASRQQRIALAGGVVRRYRERAWWGEAQEKTVDATYPWRPPEPLHWPEAGLFWSLRAVTGQGLAQARVSDRLLGVRFRRAGETAFIPGRGHRTVKKLLQELGLPPWRRMHVPLVWDGENLVAVGHTWITPAYRALQDEPGWIIDSNDQHREVVKNETIC